MAIPEKPEGNVEKFLAAMLGQEVELPEGDLSRVEQYLKELYEQGYGGGMSPETYDPDGSVAEAGGIPAYVEEHGGGGGGLPPVTGSGKALVSVDGHWKQQEGFPYDEGETVDTKFDETFSGFTRDTEETDAYYYPIDDSDVNNENNVVIGGVTYYYVDSNIYDYSSIDYCRVRDENWNDDYPSSLELIQSGEVKKVEIPYSIERTDPETGDPIDPLTGTLYGVYAPIDGAQDVDGNAFPAAGLYFTVNGDLSGSFVGVESLDMLFTYPSNYWTATVPLDSGVEFDSEKVLRVYIDGEAVEGAYADGDYLGLDASENSYVLIEEDEEFTAKAFLYVEDYETAPDNFSVKADEVVSGVHPMDGKLLFGENVQDGTALVNVGGETTKQVGYAYRTPGEYTEVVRSNITAAFPNSSIGHGSDGRPIEDPVDIGDSSVRWVHFEFMSHYVGGIYALYMHHWGDYTPLIGEESGEVRVIRRDGEIWVLVAEAGATAGADLNNAQFSARGIYTNLETEDFLRGIWIGIGDGCYCFGPPDDFHSPGALSIGDSGICNVRNGEYFADAGWTYPLEGTRVFYLGYYEAGWVIGHDSVEYVLYRVEGGAVPFDSDFIPWDNIPSDAIPWSSMPPEDIPWYDIPSDAIPWDVNPYRMPPVTGSGEALVSVNGQWAQQEGFPYEEELAETKFDETFTEFTKKESIGQYSLWAATVPLDSGIEFDSEKNYRVYIDGEVVEDAYAHGTDIDLDERGNNFVVIEESDDGFIATVWLFTVDHDTAPESMEIKVDEIVNGLHKLDSKFIPWDEIPSDAIPWSDAPEGTGLPELPSEIGTYMLTATIVSDDRSCVWTLPPDVDDEVTEDSVNLVTSGAVARAISNERRIIVECERIGQLDEYVWNMAASLYYNDIIAAIEAGREVVVRFRDDDLDGRTVELKLDSYNDESVVFGRVLPSYIDAIAVMVEFPSNLMESVTLTYVYGE